MITSLYLWLQRSGDPYTNWAAAQPLCLLGALNPSPTMAALSDRPQPLHCQQLLLTAH